ncbi:hypothetical protein PIB30_093501 [Stylosanthes scabra]|uniref:Uncharacterized protein n=1 Tax=Stylosanthes scabra TaxID=79078 RepID=A0ABU6TVX6_9FABA|nr:hypothetical protein [Stylosanthes scabra]
MLTGGFTVGKNPPVASNTMIKNDVFHYNSYRRKIPPEIPPVTFAVTFSVFAPHFTGGFCVVFYNPPVNFIGDEICSKSTGNTLAHELARMAWEGMLPHDWQSNDETRRFSKIQAVPHSLNWEASTYTMSVTDGDLAMNAATANPSDCKGNKTHRFTKLRSCSITGMRALNNSIEDFMENSIHSICSLMCLVN